MCVCFFFIFTKQALLEKTEEEDEDRGNLWSQCKIDHKLSSLQNLTECYDHLDYKKHHNSRQKKYPSSSVSSRQREGGSLPSNVNQTTSVDHVDQSVPLFNTFKKTPQQNNDNAKFNSISSQQHYNYNKNESHTYKMMAEQLHHSTHHSLAKCDDETKHLLADDALAQVCVFSNCSGFLAENKFKKNKKKNHKRVVFTSFYTKKKENHESWFLNNMRSFILLRTAT
jgi:hypothetical protein